MHKRFFVLRVGSAAGPSRLEYYENEKKWRHKSGAPKRSIPLESCFNINKRADSKNKFLVALYTKDEYFAIAADSETEQDTWYQALVALHNRGKVHDTPNGVGEDNYSEASPGPAFKEVWQVILKPKGLGQTKNLIGIYRLCLTNKTISFVKLNSDAAAVVLQLMNIRRCGHSENFFFIEVGRSAVTGPGEFWMQVDDSVVAQNMHETILEAMKAMSEEFRPRSKSQSSSSHCSNPISVPVRRHHNNNPPPSQVGLGRRSRAESVTATSPAGAGKHSHSFRVRASSDGEGSMSRPASVDGGSPNSPCSGGSRTQSYRQRAGGSARLHPPLNHSRSIPMATGSRCSPSAVSPVSLSSSSTSGHGSTSECLFPRRSSASISGSPSDGGFVSSDEYGSSPGDFKGGGFRSATPDSLGHTPPAREEVPLVSDYISMTQTPQQTDEMEPEKCFRKRTHSSGAASPPVTCHHQKTPSQSSVTSLEEYAVMLPAYPCVRPNPSAMATPSPSSSLPSATSRHSAFVTLHPYPEEVLEVVGGGASAQKDDGYMPMSPGVAPASIISITTVTTGTGVVSCGDYMPMSPKSVSAPQQIVNTSPRQCLHDNRDVDASGYMMMWPSSSCSPDGPGKLSNGPVSAGGMMTPVVPPSGDYMNMSPASSSATSTPPDCYFSTSVGGYFSLPRSFKHAHYKQPDHALSPHLSLGTGCHVYNGSSSSSTSSDSLGGGGSSHSNSQHPTREQLPLGHSKHLLETGESRLVRPTRLTLAGGRASTLPRSRQTPYQPEPRSPGEYVNIQFSNRSFSSSLAHLFPASERPSELFTSSSDRPAEIFPSSDRLSELFSVSDRPVELSAPPPTSTDYMNMQLGSSDGLSVTRVTTSDLHDLFDYAVVTPGPVPPASAALPCDSICQRDYLSMQVLSGSPVMLHNPSSLPSDPPTGSSIHSISPNVSDTPGVGGPLIGPLSGLSAFTRVSSVAPPSRSQGVTKVIRADPQGRRRHSSETFASTTTKSPVGTAGSLACSATEEVKRHSSASFENVWQPVGEPVLTMTSPVAAASVASMRRSGGEMGPMAPLLTQNQNGLNYIDLDLALAHGREQVPADWSTFSAKAGDMGGGGASEELSAYASISFSSPQDNREE